MDPSTCPSLPDNVSAQIPSLLLPTQLNFDQLAPYIDQQGFTHRSSGDYQALLISKLNISRILLFRIDPPITDGDTFEREVWKLNRLDQCVGKEGDVLPSKGLSCKIGVDTFQLWENGIEILQELDEVRRELKIDRYQHFNLIIHEGHY